MMMMCLSCTRNQPTILNQYKDIELSQMNIMIEEKDSFYIIFETTYCGSCQAFNSIFEKSEQLQDIVLYRVNIEDVEDSLETIHKYFPEFSSTPGLFVVRQGVNEGFTDFTTEGIDEDVICEWFLSHPLN